jgi:hypothetical protein
MEDLELAYLAGLFDGEGCIQIAHNKPQYNKKTEQHTLTCRVEMTDQEAVRGFLTFGGSVHIKRASEQNPKWKDQWCWTVSSNKALYFLQTIYPFIRLKKAEAECGINFQRFRKSSPYYNNQFGRGRIPITQEEIDKRECYRQELRKLKDSRFPERSWHNDKRKSIMVE